MRRFYNMKRFAKFSVVALFLGTLFAVSPSPGQSNGQTGCSLVEQALKDYQQAKSAKTRRDVEKYYVLDGGTQFPSRTRYVYPKCEYLHVDFEFEPGRRQLLRFPMTRSSVSQRFMLNTPAETDGCAVRGSTAT
jgi:hypothetical protein